MTVQDVSCFTCSKACDAIDRTECFHRFLVSWSPMDVGLCDGCDMYSGKSGGCDRHAEPCAINGYNDERFAEKCSDERNERIYRREQRMYRRVLGDGKYGRPFTRRGKETGPRRDRKKPVQEIGG